MEDTGLINVHSIIPSSRVNGPGKRLVVFFQGCRFDCPGCFNPETHTFEKKELLSPDDILSRGARREIEGITVSGGEPFEQPRGLLRLLKASREIHSLSTMVYTGHTYEELLADSVKRECLDYIDVLIEGRFMQDKKETTTLTRGSTNQRIMLLTGRYEISDLEMPGRTEIIISHDGRVTRTGFTG